ncbi:natriuretic peptides A isoform X1 [Aquarana catesbeiana]|uniref:natriuretic peptides A isoform X1 n=1 Tax=Aquarana catesbeiana TaxID=8400 RepID=UPI003CC99DF4
MGTSFVGYLTFVLLLLALTKVRGGPAYNSPLSSDLSDLKGLLERLEDRLPVEEVETPVQDIFAPNYDSADSSNSAPSLTVEAARPGADMMYNRGSWTQQEKSSPLRNKLRELLNAPRSMRRSSDCFGSRIDRIGAQSGMGCGRRVSDLKGDGQLGHVGWF